jgi:hypothetical protein
MISIKRMHRNFLFQEMNSLIFESQLISNQTNGNFEVGTHGCILTGTNLAMVEFDTCGCVLTGTKP